MIPINVPLKHLIGHLLPKAEWLELADNGEVVEEL